MEGVARRVTPVYRGHMSDPTLTTTAAFARRLANQHPVAKLPCPACAAEVKGENLDKHLRKVHALEPGESSGPVMWAGERIGTRRPLRSPAHGSVGMFSWTRPSSRSFSTPSRTVVPCWCVRVLTWTCTELAQTESAIECGKFQADGAPDLKIADRLRIHGCRSNEPVEYGVVLKSTVPECSPNANLDIHRIFEVRCQPKTRHGRLIFRTNSSISAYCGEFRPVFEYNHLG